MLQSSRASDQDMLAQYMRAAHIQPGGKIVNLDDQSMWFTARELQSLQLKAQDVVMVEGGAGYGRSAYLAADLDGWGFQNSILRIRRDPERAVGAFVHYALSAALDDGQIAAACNQATFAHFTAEKVAAFEIPVPALASQQAVVDFLDRETTEIDAFIADQEELIALLTERRAAAITHAVTKGLDPSAPMNESGLAWLGDLPAQWRLMPFGFAVLYREGPGIGAVDFRDEGVPLIRIAGVRGRFATLAGCNFLDPVAVASRWQRFQIERGDLLVSASASMGTVSEAGSDVVGAIPYTGIIRMKPRGGINRDYLRLFLESSAFMTQIDLLKTGSTIQHYGPEHLRQMYIPVPRERDQKIIAEHLTHQIAELDATIADAREAIALSKERRAALISAAVTGKIDVRGLA
ncbi:restriction endonuclease subunit S [Microbacterium sp. NPDC090218]